MSTPPMWQRRHILEMHKMMRVLRPMMQPDHFQSYITLWADLIGSSNPLFRREHFFVECWREDI